MHFMRRALCYASSKPSGSPHPELRRGDGDCGLTLSQASGCGGKSSVVLLCSCVLRDSPESQDPGLRRPHLAPRRLKGPGMRRPRDAPPLRVSALEPRRNRRTSVLGARAAHLKVPRLPSRPIHDFQWPGGGLYYVGPGCPPRAAPGIKKGSVKRIELDGIQTHE